MYDGIVTSAAPLEWFPLGVNDYAKSTQDTVQLSAEASELMNDLMKHNYDRIYKNPHIEKYSRCVRDIMKVLFDRFAETQKQLGDDVSKYMADEQLRAIQYFGKFIADRRMLYFRDETYTNDAVRRDRIVIDFLATLTDRFALDAVQEFFHPMPII